MRLTITWTNAYNFQLSLYGETSVISRIEMQWVAVKNSFRIVCRLELSSASCQLFNVSNGQNYGSGLDIRNGKIFDGSLTRYEKLWVTHAPGMPRTLTSFEVNWRGKRSRHSLRMLNPQFSYLARGLCCEFILRVCTEMVSIFFWISENITILLRGFRLVGLIYKHCL